MESSSVAPEVPDFLREKSERAVKRELRGILQSYHHFWDILAELLQNSRDAVERRRNLEIAAGEEPTPGRVHVLIDAVSRAIEVTDNGTGISPEMVREVLAPGGGDKSAADDQVGEKGMGLTYVAFSGDRFTLRTRTAASSSTCTLSGSSTWVQSDDSSVYPPKFVITDKVDVPEGYEAGTFTAMRISGIPSKSSRDIFALTGEQLKWILRTRTALGDTRTLLRGLELPEMTVTYEWIAVDGSAQEDVMKLGYPDLAGPAAVTIEEVNSNLVGKSSAASRKYLAAKVVMGHKTIGSGSDTLRVFGVMFPGNKVFDQLLEKHFLGPVLDDESPLLQSGIFVVTKSMPTGIQIEPGQKGAYPAYYKRCIFLVESDQIEFDLGRKSMHWRHKKRLQDAVAELFLQFERVAKFQGPADSVATSPTSETSAERKLRIKKMWEEAEGRHELGWSGVPFGKVPTNQEAAVAALFHELLGAKLVKDFRPLAAGYATQYDLLAHYVGGGDELPVVIEFKDKLESVAADLRDGVKHIGDMDLLVCWDFNHVKIAEVGLTMLAVAEHLYDGVTHELHLPVEISTEPIPVIVLKTLLEKSQASAG